MRLTTFTNFALRTLMYAAMRGNSLSRAQDVADAFGISRAHMLKCIHQLGVWGYLENVRGRSGGFRLAKPPEQITVGEVVRRTEDSLDLVECFDPDTNTCPLIQLCALSQTLRRALQAFLAELDQVTIADVTSDRILLWARLHPDAAQPPSAATAMPLGRAGGD